MRLAGRCRGPSARATDLSDGNHPWVGPQQDEILRGSQLPLRLVHYRSQQGTGEFPANRRSDLRYLLGRAKPVKPSHERGM